jgi:hypothetical protein
MSELKPGVTYKWVVERSEWCTGCGCNNYATGQCIRLDNSRIVLGLKERIEVVGGTPHRFSTAMLSYCKSEQAAQEAIQKGLARPVTQADFRRPLMLAY